MNGVPDSPANRYVQVSNAKISNNSFFDVKAFTFGAGANSELTLPPITSEFSNNIMVSDNDDAIRLKADVSGIRFSGNSVNFDGSKIGATKNPGLTGVRAARP